MHLISKTKSMRGKDFDYRDLKQTKHSPTIKQNISFCLHFQSYINHRFQKSIMTT